MKPGGSDSIGAIGVVFLASLAVAFSPISAADLFAGDSTLAIVLEGPWRSIRGERDPGVTLAGRARLAGSPGDGADLAVEIKVRGGWRLENCRQPPLTLVIDDARSAATSFAGHQVVHVTPQCRRGERYREHLVQEHLIYRAFGLLSEVALQTRLAVVEYRDPERPDRSETAYAILIEDLGLAARRLGLELSEREAVAPGALDAGSAALFALFQYMIGHTDWSILQGSEGERCCHNAALFAPGGPGPSSSGLLPVPYDFDASGLVDHGEIEPAAQLPILSVRHRLYRGLCIHGPHVGGAVERLERARPEIEALFVEEELLSPKSRRRTARYLEAFYEIVADPKKLEDRVHSKCRD